MLFRADAPVPHPSRPKLSTAHRAGVQAGEVHHGVVRAGETEYGYKFALIDAMVGIGPPRVGQTLDPAVQVEVGNGL